MEVLKFTLKGKFAFFKKPDLNSYIYFTYGNIHKVTLLGMFGAILGYKGYNSMSFEKKYAKQFKDRIKKSSQDYPEFYEKLEGLKVAIAPNKVSIDKKIQIFNNSVGYASRENGCNLIVKEQWLENPSWDIYISIDNDESKKLCTAILNKEYVYIPYLGKNDHLADISDAQLISDVVKLDNPKHINSLYRKNDFNIVAKQCDDFDDDDAANIEDEIIFKYEERLPISLELQTNKYEYEDFIFTNSLLEGNGDVEVYSVNDRNIVFI